jgi:cytochrome c
VMKPGLSRAVKILLGLGVLLTLIVAASLEGYGWRRFPEPRVFPELAEGDARLGREAIIAHGCGACHVIPGIRTATGRVGPQLTGIRDQVYIAGILANNPPNMIAWIRDPKQFNPDTAMPDLGVTEIDALHIAAYLYEMR